MPGPRRLQRVQHLKALTKHMGIRRTVLVPAPECGHPSVKWPSFLHLILSSADIDKHYFLYPFHRAVLKKKWDHTKEVPWHLKLYIFIGFSDNITTRATSFWLANSPLWVVVSLRIRATDSWLSYSTGKVISKTIQIRELRGRKCIKVWFRQVSRWSEATWEVGHPGVEPSGELVRTQAQADACCPPCCLWHSAQWVRGTETTRCQTPHQTQSQEPKCTK